MTRPDARFAGLPEPATNRLVIYVFGPAPGESQVVALPDGRWMVIDGCVEAQSSVPDALLNHFGVKAVDLLVVTHPDIDHYRGLAPIVRSKEVHELWRYPGLATQRDTVARLCDLDPQSGRYAELRDLLKEIDQLARDNRAFEVGLGDQTWPHAGGSDYEVHCLAPCGADRQAELERFQRFFDKVARGERLDAAEDRVVVGAGDGGRGNPLSLALVLRWGAFGVLFGGDVEAPSPPSKHGWNGILESLERRAQLHRVENLALVKVPHHGSRNAQSAAAWAKHASRGPVTAIVTPFNRAPSMPPHADALGQIRAHANRLWVTSPPHSTGWGVVDETEWESTPHDGTASASVVAIAVERGGSKLEVGGRGARIFTT